MGELVFGSQRGAVSAVYALAGMVLGYAGGDGDDDSFTGLYGRYFLLLGQEGDDVRLAPVFHDAGRDEYVCPAATAAGFTVKSEYLPSFVAFPEATVRTAEQRDRAA
jgi:hypothetical protein